MAASKRDKGGDRGLVPLSFELNCRFYLLRNTVSELLKSGLFFGETTLYEAVPLQQSGRSPKFFGIFRCSPCARTTSYPACLTPSFSPSGAYKRITDRRGTIARSPPPPPIIGTEETRHRCSTSVVHSRLAPAGRSSCHHVSAGCAELGKMRLYTSLNSAAARFYVSTERMDVAAACPQSLQP